MNPLGPQPISAFQLALASAFILISGAISFRLSLGLEKTLLLAAARTYLQLIALGFVLQWLFAVDSALLVAALLVLMAAMSVRILLGRVKKKPSGLYGPTFAAMLTSSMTVVFTVTAVIIGVEPWHAPQYVIPIAGMTLGNSMSGVGLGLDRFFGDLASRRGVVERRLALGANPAEASLPELRAAASAAMTPTINGMTAVGVVFIPGMMSGQIVAGADPMAAAFYQIVVMFMISAASAIGSFMALRFAVRKAFEGDGLLKRF